MNLKQPGFQSHGETNKVKVNKPSHYFPQGRMWRKWRPQMQTTLPTETALEWCTASSTASRTSPLTPKQVKHLSLFLQVIDAKFINIFIFYFKVHESDVSEKKCLCFMCTLATAARQSCSEIRLSRSLVLNDMSDWVPSKQPTSGTIHQDKKTDLSTEPWDTKGHKKTVKYLFDLTQFRRSPLSVRVIYDIRDLKYLFQKAQDKRTDVKFLLVMAAHNVLGWICGMSTLFATYQNVRQTYKLRVPASGNKLISLTQQWVSEPLLQANWVVSVVHS